MRDYLFYPLALLMVSAIIALSLIPFLGRPPNGPLSVAGNGDRTYLKVEGRDLYRLRTGRPAIITMKDMGEPPIPEYVTISASHKDMAYFLPELGPHFEIAADLEQHWGGRTLEIIITARAADDAGADQFEVNYASGREEASGWQRFALTPEFKSYTLSWEPPEAALGELGKDYFGIRPVIPEKNRSIDIKSIEFRSFLMSSS